MYLFPVSPHTFFTKLFYTLASLFNLYQCFNSSEENMKHNESERNLLLSCLFSQIAWIISAVLLLFIFCAIAYSTADPASLTTPLSLCALYLSSLFGGIAAVRISGDGIASGALSGLFTALLVFIISALPLPDSAFALPQSIIYTSLVIPASIIGAVIGHKKSRTANKQRAKIKKARSRMVTH